MISNPFIRWLYLSLLFDLLCHRKMMPLCHILIDGNCLTEIEYRLKSIATDFFVSVKMINCKALILAQTDRSLAHLLIRGDNSL